MAGEHHGSNKCGQHHPPTFISLLSHARQRKSHGLQRVTLNSVNCKQQVCAKNHQHQINIKCVQKHHPPTFPCQAMCVSEQTLLGGRTPWSKYMRTTPPATNIYFIVSAKTIEHQINTKCAKKHRPPTFISLLKALRWVRRGVMGGRQKKKKKNVCMIKCKQKVGEKNQHHGPNKCVQQHHHHQHLLIPVC